MLSASEVRRLAWATALENLGHGLLRLAASIRADDQPSEPADNDECWPPICPNFNDESWLNTTEVVQDFAISEGHLRRLLSKDGYVFAVRDGGRWQINRDRFAAYRQGRF